MTALSPKEGTSVGDDGNGWSHTVYTATPGIRGDSGSAFLDRSGRALGVLSTVRSRRCPRATASATSRASSRTSPLTPRCR
jgi:hypothetical protein